MAIRIYIKPGILLGFFLIFLKVQAQYSYKLNKVSDPLIAAGSTIIFSGSLYFQHQVKPLSEPSILALNKNDINRFDRIACQYWNKDIAKISDGLAIGSGIMYLYFLAKPETRASSFKISCVAFQSLMLSQALSNAFKLTLRNRPFMYNENLDISFKRSSDARMSFFSAHTSTVSSLCYSFAFAHGTYLNNGKPKPVILMTAALVPAIEGFLRVRAGKHYPSDVICGYLIGLGSSYLMHRLHLAKL